MYKRDHHKKFEQKKGAWEKFKNGADWFFETMLIRLTYSIATGIVIGTALAIVINLSVDIQSVPTLAERRLKNFSNALADHSLSLIHI